jgi:hypothetical protein
MNDIYILNKDKEPVLEKDLEKAGKWLSKPENRIIKQIEVQQYFISTVFLGFDHSFNYGYRKILFETMVFKNKNSKNSEAIECYRHSTYKEAFDFHNDLVKKYKEKVKNKMTENLFICRGISKETNEFVFGYYFYEKQNKRHVIIRNEKIDNADYFLVEKTQIIQKPDRSLNFIDKNGKNIFEHDNIKVNDEISENIELDVWHSRLQDIWCGIDTEDVEVIGNIYKK